MSKNLYIETLGCAKNQVDSEVLACRLGEDGWKLVDEASKADLILVNSCGFLESARYESITAVMSLRKSCPEAKILLCGCMAQRYPEDLYRDMSEIDGVFGNRDLGKIGEAVKSLYEGQRPSMVPQFPEHEYEKREKLFSYPGSAFLKISEGCNHHCAYCAIPIIRGDLRSRGQEAILEDARSLIAQGIVEINLVAQDLAAWGMDKGKSAFISLLDAICKIEGDFKVRLLYIHPDLFSDELLEAIANEPKVLPYFDIPFQHADPRILRAMGRTGSLESYSLLVEKIRKRIPQSTIRTTIMLGFPGETDETFAAAMEFVKRNRFDWLGSFAWSREESTKAYDLVTDSQYEELSKRAAKYQKKLEKVQEQITRENLKRFLGTRQTVLIEEKVEEESLWLGRIAAQAPDVDGLTVVSGDSLSCGKTCEVIITEVNGVDLFGVLA